MKCMEFIYYENISYKNIIIQNYQLILHFWSTLDFFLAIHLCYFLRYIFRTVSETFLLWKERFNNNKTTMTSHLISIKKNNKKTKKQKTKNKNKKQNKNKNKKQIKESTIYVTGNPCLAWNRYKNVLWLNRHTSYSMNRIVNRKCKYICNIIRKI